MAKTFIKLTLVLLLALLISQDVHTNSTQGVHAADTQMETPLFFPLIVTSCTSIECELCAPDTGPYLNPDGEGLVFDADRVIYGTTYPSYDEDEYYFDVAAYYTSYSLSVRQCTAYPNSDPDAVYSILMDVYNPQGGLERENVIGYSISTALASRLGRWKVVIHGPTYKPEGVGCYQLEYWEN